MTQTMNDQEIRQALLKTTRRAYFQDRMFAATSGNLSVYDRATGRMYITPGSYPYEDMTEADLVAIDLDGNTLEGRLKPSSEWKLHAAIYRAFEGMNAVVHTHSPYATAFAINHLPIPVVLYELAWFLGGDVPVAEGALPGSPEVGENVIRALEGKERYGCLMGNHSSEWRMHAEIYKNRPDVRAIVHTHSPYATAFAINHLPIPVVLYEIAWFLGGDIPVAEGALPGSPEVGENCVKVLKDRNGCLMGNHGAVAFGETLAQAYTRAVYIEDAAKAYSLALTHGPVRVVESAEVNRFLGRE